LEIEDIEDILFDANESGLYKLKIDYINKMLRFSHLKNNSVSQKDVENLKGKISCLKDRLDFFIKRIDLLNK
jgi:hypothetical protein